MNKLDGFYAVEDLKLASDVYFPEDFSVCF